MAEDNYTYYKLDQKSDKQIINDCYNSGASEHLQENLYKIELQRRWNAMAHFIAIIGIWVIWHIGLLTSILTILSIFLKFIQ